jgi:sulfhydrogenase subunit gamma (sulfur reductase)
MVTTLDPRANPYLPTVMRVAHTTVTSEDGTLRTLDLEFADSASAALFRFRPGQFCTLSVFGVGEAPFGIASAPDELAGLRFTISRTGVLTEAIHSLAIGDPIGVRGPFGNGFPMDTLAGHNLVIVGGGFAFTTLRSLLYTVLGERERFGNVTVVYGARTPGMLLYRKELEAWGGRGNVAIHLTADQGAPGWPHHVGFVPAVLQEVAPSAEDACAVLCGPPAMLRFTRPVLDKLGFPPERVYTSLERRMKCGVGHCGRCNIGPKHVCKDGPVFSFAELDQLPAEP